MDRRDLTDHHSSSLERTALWVEAQSTETYEDTSPPPSPSSSSMKNSTPSSNRTTASSEQSISSTRRRGPPPSPSAMRPFPTTTPSSSNVHTTPNQRLLPFPHSPPGSGYPMTLEVLPPRAAAEPERGSQRKASRPSLVKKRRPSILNQIMSFGDWKREEGGK